MKYIFIENGHYAYQYMISNVSGHVIAEMIDSKLRVQGHQEFETKTAFEDFIKNYDFWKTHDFQKIQNRFAELSAKKVNILSYFQQDFFAKLPGDETTKRQLSDILRSGLGSRDINQIVSAIAAQNGGKEYLLDTHIYNEAKKDYDHKSFMVNRDEIHSTLLDENYIDTPRHSNRANLRSVKDILNFKNGDVEFEEVHLNSYV